MLKFSKKTEYGILAMQYIARNTDRLSTAKEISENLSIPFDFLSKTLQTLMKSGLIVSQQGKAGGYSLMKPAIEITIAEIIDALDETSSVVVCSEYGDEANCQRQESCTIKEPMNLIQHKINTIFTQTTLAEFEQG